MAFNKRTWLGRQGTGLNKFSIGGASPVTIVNQPDSVTQVGDALSAGNLNDLEDRIEDAFDDVDTELDTKADEQDVTNLNNAITQLDHRLENIEQSKGDYVVSNYKDGSITPSGKGAWSIVEGLRGVSRVENNALSTIDSFGLYHCSLVSYSEGVLTVTGFSVGSQVYKPSIVVPSDRTVLGGIWVKPSKATYAYVSLGSSTLVNTVQLPANVWTFLCNEKALTSATVEFSLYVNVNNDLGASDTVQVKEAFLTDLTVYFNGNIPSNAQTIADIQQNYPELLIPSDYDAGSLVSTTYSAVKSVGKNLFDETTKFLANGFTFSGGYWSRTALVALFETGISFKPNTQYAFSYKGHCSVSNVNFRFSVDYTDGTSVDTSIITSTTDALYTWVSASGKTISSISTTFGNSGSVYFEYLQIEEGSSATSYSQYMTDTLSLPSPVTLRSAGSVADTLELNVEVDGVARRRQTTRIGSVDLGSLNWTKYQTRFYATISDAYSSSDNTINLLCEKYIPKAEDTQGYMWLYTGRIYIHDENYANEFAFKSAMDGVILYYELATYVETLSDPLLDNTLLTEAGGRMATVQTGTVVDGIADLGFITL